MCSRVYQTAGRAIYSHTLQSGGSQGLYEPCLYTAPQTLNNYSNCWAWTCARSPHHPNFSHNFLLQTSNPFPVTLTTATIFHHQIISQNDNCSRLFLHGRNALGPAENALAAADETLMKNIRAERGLMNDLAV